MSELALSTRLEPEQHDFVATIRASADSLLTVINDILDFSKIESGKFSLQAQTFDVREEIAQTMKMFVAGARPRGLQLTCVVDEQVPPMAGGDAGRLRQVLVNLVGNALKFTERGGVAVQVGVQEIDARARCCCASASATRASASRPTGSRPSSSRSRRPTVR